MTRGAPLVTSWLGPRNRLPDGAAIPGGATAPGQICGFSSHSIAAFLPGRIPLDRFMCATGQAAPGLFPLAIAPPGFSLSVSIAFCALAAP